MRFAHVDEALSCITVIIEAVVTAVNLIKAVYTNAVDYIAETLFVLIESCGNNLILANTVITEIVPITYICLEYHAVAFVAVTVLEVIPIAVDCSPAPVVATRAVIILCTENSLCPNAVLQASVILKFISYTAECL